MRASDFDFALPPEQIAQAPLAERDQSRLYVLDRQNGDTHRHIRDLPELLPPNALLVLNDTRVIPARLRAKKPSGGRAELLLIEPLGERSEMLRGGFAAEDARSIGGDLWRCIGGASKPIRPGPLLIEGEGAPACEVLRVEGEFLDVRLSSDEPLLEWLERLGEVPLPPYIHRHDPEDKLRYQTVFARQPGAVAAPTAGLHFTPELLSRFDHVFVTLHVGPGTFAPLRSDEIAPDQPLHAERYHVPDETARRIAEARQSQRPIVAVGTTVVRTLESAFRDGAVRAGSGSTRLFIKPGHRFSGVDHLVTNFHLPRSTLLMLVAAFAGRERILAAYAEAVKAGYRFFSYGDAMLIL